MSPMDHDARKRKELRTGIEISPHMALLANPKHPVGKYLTRKGLYYLKKYTVVLDAGSGAIRWAGLKCSPNGICYVLPPPPSLPLRVNTCVQIPRLWTHRRGKHLALMKAVSGNFTLSHACSHVNLPRAKSLPVSDAERTQDAPSGDAGIKQVEQVGGWLVVALREGRGQFVVLNMVLKSDSNAEHRLKQFILILRGFSGWKTRKDPLWQTWSLQMDTNPHRQLYSPFSFDDNDENKSGVEEGQGSPSADPSRGERGETEGQGPASCLSPSVLLPDKCLPSPTP